MSHAIARAKERYGVELTEDDLRKIHALCDTSNRVRVTGRGNIHLVRYAGCVMVAVVRDVAITTFLAHDHLRAGAQRAQRARTNKPKQKRKPKRQGWGPKQRKLHKRRTNKW